MKTIKAIETRYKGYRFRSRLEARWAVYLDALNESWEYEKEGYSLASGCYLPDFWLSRMGVWLEVKPEEPTDHERQKCQELAFFTGDAVVIVKGLPGERHLSVFCFDETDGSAGDQWWDKCQLNIDVHGQVCIDSGNDRSSRTFLMSGSYTSFDVMKLSSECFGSCRFDIAANRAKAARFEHGESG